MTEKVRAIWHGEVYEVQPCGWGGCGKTPAISPTGVEPYCRAHLERGLAQDYARHKAERDEALARRMGCGS